MSGLGGRSESLGRFFIRGSTFDTGVEIMAPADPVQDAMFQTLLDCPNCQRKVSLEDARRVIPAIPLPESSTAFKKVALVYTVCPKCRRDIRITGERTGAIAMLAIVFGLLAASFVFVDFWVPLALLAATLIGQKKIAELFVRAHRA